MKNDESSHTDDCIHPPFYAGYDACECDDGSWCQPDDFWVAEATAQLPEDAPWCRVSALAWELEAAAVAAVVRTRFEVVR